MSPEQLYLELKKLSHLDKLHAIQILVAELRAEEEAKLKAGASQEFPVPYDDEAASQVLSDFLHSEQKKGDS
jgi:hypothetical protein